MVGAGTTRAGTALTATAVAGGLTLLASANGSTRATIISAIAGALLGGLVLVRVRDTPLGTTAASLFVPVVALLAVAGLGLSILDAATPTALENTTLLVERLLGHVGVSFAAGVATAGTVGTLADGIGDGGVTGLWKTTVATAIPVGIWLAASFVFQEGATIAVGGVDTGAITRPIFRPDDVMIGLVTLSMLAIAFLVTIRWALNAAPILELAPRSRRSSLEDTLERVDATLRIARTWAIVVAVVATTLVAAGRHTELFSIPPSARPLLAATTNGGIRTTLGLGIVAAVSITSAVWLLGRLTGNAAAFLRRVGPSVLGGVVTVVVVTLASPLIRALVSVVPAEQRPLVENVVARHTPTVVALSVVAIALAALGTLLATVAFSGGIGLLPSRASAGVLASGGLALGAVVVGVTNGRPPVVFGVVALSILAWDVSERGVVTRAELDAVPAPRTEVVQALGTTVVVGGAAVLAWAIYTRALPRITAPNATAVGVLSAVLATLLLVFALRG